jgi:hypothetical protein
MYALAGAASGCSGYAVQVNAGAAAVHFWMLQMTLKFCIAVDAAAGAAAAAAAAAAGPEGIPAGQQVCISYGSWPAEPFLLLFGFVPQPNPHDCITLFSNMQHMADCYLACCAATLQAAGAADNGGSSSAQQGGSAATGAQQLLQSQAFRVEFMQQVASIEQALTQQQIAEGSAGGPGGFHDVIANASGVDGRLAAALSGIHQAVAAAAAAAAAAVVVVKQDAGEAAAAAAVVQQLQLPLGAVLLHRLQQVAHDLDQSSSTSSSRGVETEQQEQDGVGAEEDDSSWYEASAAHAELIQQYCSSKAALARQLTAQYSSGSAQ